jgi:O-antigen/teichoic acid export membrane protein
MNTARTITSNFLSLSISEITSKTLQLGVFVFLARYLGAENFGIFSFGIAFALLIVIIADFGLSTFLIREISRSKRLASKYLTNALFVKIFLTLATLIAAHLFLSLMGYSTGTRAVAFIMLAFALLQSYTDLFYSIFRAFEKMHYDAFVKVLRMLILASAVFYVIRGNLGIVSASLVFPATELVVLLITASLVYTRFIKPSFEFDFAFSKGILRKSSLFCLSIVFSGLFMYIDTIMLSKLSSTTEVGIYAAASNIMLALIFIPMMYGNAIYPVISRFFIKSKGSLKFAYEKSFKYMLILGLPISAGIYVLSEKIILFLYGREYIESAIVISILAWYMFLRFMNVISGFTLSSINRQGSRVFSQGMAALANVILNFIFIPLYGALGAALATLITEIIFFLTYTSFIIKYGLRINFVGKFIKPAAAAGIMVYAISFISNLFAGILAGAIFYCAVLFSLGTIDKEDKRIFRKIISSK